MLGGSTRVKGTTWSPGGRWGPWCTPTMCSTYSLELVKWSVRVWLLTVLVSFQSTSPFPTSSSSAHGEECPKALKKDQPPHCTLLPPHFPAKIREERVIKRTGQPCPRRCSPACTLASRVKSNILVINVTIKLLHREIWRFIFSLYMKKSDIIAINVIIKLPQMGIWRLIFSQYMKKSNILAINVIIKLQERAIWRKILTLWSGDLKTHIQKNSNILAINVIIKLQETNIAMRERGRDRSASPVLFLF